MKAWLKYFIPMLAASGLLLIPCFAGTQSSFPLERIHAPIDETLRTPLKGNVHPLARMQYDHGAADPSLQLERVTMMFQPTPEQQADLDALLAAQQNPASASFHKWLTPQQYGDRFGIAPSDLAKVAAWLDARGFAVVETPASRNFIVFSGTAGQVSAAFHSEIHNYEANGRKFYANSSQPSVPAALAGIVTGFRGFNSVRLKPRSIPSQPASASVQPQFTSSLTGNNYVTPGDFATIYDLNPLYSASPAIDGTGQKIVIVGQSQVVLGDIATFRSLSGLPPNAPQEILVPTSASPGVVNGDVQESSVDIEWAGAVARNATIIFVYSGNGVLDALQFAVSQNYAPVISISYGSCEAENPLSEIQSLTAIAQQANAQGITIVSSVGDGGATDCDGDVGNYPAELGLSVDFPGSLPYVTGVGGTEFNEGNGTYWQAASGADVISSALSYIPEMVWNDTLALSVLNAGGGGASAIFGKPSWQAGTGVPADGARDVPDIALNASDAHDSYLICTEIQLTPNGPLTPGCQNGFRVSTTNTELTAYGGTSFGAPTFAGIVALINQNTGSSGQGNLNYILYPLASISPAAFHDITAGNNDSPCVLYSPGCFGVDPIGYSAGLAYDPVTGLGSIDAANLVNSWSSVSAAAGSTPVLSSISPTSITAGAGDFTLTASGSNFAANAQILWNGSAAGVTMQPGGTSTIVKATISHTLAAYGTSTAGTLGAVPPYTSTFVSVTDDAAKAGESSSAQPFTVNGTPPANDNIANATVITSSDYSNAVDNSAATQEATDPVPPCVFGSSNPDTKTVWWTFTSAGTSNVTVSTIGSSYDTTLSVWTGTPGSLTNVACNDDVSSGRYTQSLLTFGAAPGTNYYIMVAPFGPAAGESSANQAGGKTVLNVDNAPVANSPAVITSAGNATFVVGVAGSFTVTATGSPAPTFTESGGLPGGVRFNPVTGTFSGVPYNDAARTYPITITAQNGVGNPATQNFTLLVNQPASFTNAATTTFTVGSLGYFLVSIIGAPTPVLSESGALPPGVTLNAGNGLLGGTPSVGAGGTYPLTFTAHNGTGTDAVQHFTLTVNEAPSITSASSAVFVLGTFGTFNVIAAGSPAPTLTETGSLPPGVTFNSSTGVLSGTPAAGSSLSYTLTFSAQNIFGTSPAQTFTLMIVANALSATPTSQTVAAGSSATFAISNAGSLAYALSCIGLPTGASCGPVSVPGNSNATLVITTTSRSAGVLPATNGTHFRIPMRPNVSIAMVLFLALFFTTVRRRRFATLPFGGFALLLVFIAAGCGAVGGSSGTPAGKYTITVTGTSSGAPPQPVNITLSVT